MKIILAVEGRMPWLWERQRQAGLLGILWMKDDLIPNWGSGGGDRKDQMERNLGVSV